MSRPTEEERQPGDPAPETGEYHLINVLGSHTGRSVALQQGQPLPPAPRGFWWTMHRSPESLRSSP